MISAAFRPATARSVFNSKPAFLSILSSTSVIPVPDRARACLSRNSSFSTLSCSYHSPTSHFCPPHHLYHSPPNYPHPSQHIHSPSSLTTASTTTTRMASTSPEKTDPGTSTTRGQEGGNLKQPEGPEDWKHRAPYRIHESNGDFNALYDGSCHCGKVQFSLSREKPLASKFCHCTTCQRLHGTRFFFLFEFSRAGLVKDLLQ